jgi:dTDP-4-dehydrorhamnose 3,5-epimerase-like enzyme
MNVSKPKILEFPQNGNSNTGYLSFVEDTSSVPFDIKRVYWIYGIPEMVTRGNHAHKHDEQVIICINGTADIEIIDQEQQKTYFSLDKASQGLYVPKLYWKNIKLSKGACLLCISSTLYDENGYIKDFNEFILK